MKRRLGRSVGSDDPCVERLIYTVTALALCESAMRDHRSRDHAKDDAAVQVLHSAMARLHESLLPVVKVVVLIADLNCVVGLVAIEVAAEATMAIHPAKPD